MSQWLKRWGNRAARLARRSPDPFAVFLEPNALRINEARLRHLASLGLDLNHKTVLEAGAGIGLHTGFFEERGCPVLSLDARPENVAEIRRRYPGRRAEVLDLEQTTDLSHLGMFDVIYCYGLLYHLAEPEQALASLAGVCREMILLETCVTPGDEVAPYRVTENPGSRDQAFSGHGCRPTRPWVMEMLRQYYGYAYTTLTQPRHPDFDLNWARPVPKPLHRAVFVGSKAPLAQPSLLDHLSNYQAALPDG